MTERTTESPEQRVDRKPTYDSFNDPDEALAWVLERVHAGRTDEKVREWWTSPRFDGISAEVIWETDPNRIIALVY